MVASANYFKKEIYGSNLYKNWEDMVLKRSLAVPSIHCSKIEKYIWIKSELKNHRYLIEVFFSLTEAGEEYLVNFKTALGKLKQKKAGIMDEWENE